MGGAGPLGLGLGQVSFEHVDTWYLEVSHTWKVSDGGSPQPYAPLPLWPWMCV